MIASLAAMLFLSSARSARAADSPANSCAIDSNETAEANIEELRKYFSPRIDGNVLRISGRIDSHIYDYLAREAKALDGVRVIELDSFGGNFDWAIQVARKVRALGVITRIPRGHACASACVPIFAAGVRREASRDAFIGIHGARPSFDFIRGFAENCASRQDSPACVAFMEGWRQLALRSTNEMFSFMEQNGVAPALRRDYFALPDDPDWLKAENVVKKLDWCLSVPNALEYNLVTRVLD